MTLEEHAIAWWQEKGAEIPPLDSAEWKSMYEEWAEWAFSNL